MLVLAAAILVILILVLSRSGVRLIPDNQGRVKVSRSSRGRKARRKNHRAGVITRTGDITRDRICPECHKPESLCRRDQRRAGKFL